MCSVSRGHAALCLVGLVWVRRVCVYVVLVVVCCCCTVSHAKSHPDAATAPRGHDSTQVHGGKADPLRKIYGRH